MAQVIRKVMASSVSFSQDNREVIVGNKHLPLVSAVISAVSDRPLVAFGVRNHKGFISAANSAGYKGADKLLNCAKDTLAFAAGKSLLVKDGSTYGINEEYREVADSIVDYVGKSTDSKQKEDKVVNSKGKGGRKAGKQPQANKSKDLKRFRVGDDGNLVRLTRGKPSPFWTLIEAPESYDGAKVIGDDGKLMGLPSGFTLLQVAAEREDKPAKAKAKSAGAGKAAKSKGISEDDINALVVAQVCEYTRDLSVKLDALTDLVKSLIAKVDSLQGVQATVSQPLSDDSEKAIADAKLEAVEDMRKVSEEFASICTTL